MVSDKIGRKASLVLMCAAQGIIMFAFYKIGGSSVGLIVGACIIGFNFGGNFALFPAATADYFGNKNVGTNYGWVFLAYGCGRHRGVHRLLGTLSTTPRATLLLGSRRL